MKRKVHRTLGLVLALPVAVWAITGLLFHVKVRYGEAYETLRAPVPKPDLSVARLAPAELGARGLVDPECLPRLAVRPDGRLGWFGSRSGTPAAVDATTGEPLPPASEADARRWAESAVAASAYRSRYGSSGLAAPTERRSSLTGARNPAFRFAFAGGKSVTVDRLTGEIDQTGDLNAFIDATYRLHYLQWTPWQSVNVALVLVALPALLALAATGLRLFLQGSWQDRAP